MSGYFNEVSTVAFQLGNRIEERGGRLIDVDALHEKLLQVIKLYLMHYALASVYENQVAHACRKDAEKADHSISRHPEFRYKTEFQSHEPEFDYLKSLEIEEKINQIKWCQAANGALYLLSTNDKTIKFWKVQEKKVKKLSEMNLDRSAAPANGSPGGVGYLSPSLSNGNALKPGRLPLLRLPVVTSQETSLATSCRRVYAHAHDYHINSISNNRSCTYIHLNVS
ncbi:serine/threonine protein phosphatase 2A 55 kDa regulatory subunit B beta isoform [Zea mays]|uniref:serine/threonine protein phosphatase 2A 55 kDa regulatory subunit B beta isoform n=1 Tax=Zea mays TaxID=4577 RepID=UPI0009AAA6D8|nr:serine/threonine protein phosphatase 2A 55 kDa regulatory subunit B beta isoform-like [Zea mays]|eukprot:XP_020398497.1 serine/threonine protein phosphatase 2A 55 kDa regulatory subunit B beta isoform-like [Zea mays]